jgi:hypothetical protein
VNSRYCLLAVVLLGACAKTPAPLVVRQYQLRDQDPGNADEPLVRMEKERRLRGAVSMEERRGKLGQYFTMLWNDQAGAGTADVEIVFEYQQGASASRVKHMTSRFPASDKSGTAEFAVIGEDYFKNGRVLAWKASLRRGSTLIATRRSYLWQEP